MDTKDKKNLFLEQLPRKNFNVARTCEAVGIVRATFYVWKKEDAEFKQAVIDLEEADIDDSEDSLRTLRKGIPKRNAKGEFVGWITRPDITAIIFHLKTKGKSRGYIETNDNVNRNIDFGSSDLPDEKEMKEKMDLYKEIINGSKGI